jgi:hypothetical protein
MIFFFIKKSLEQNKTSIKITCPVQKKERVRSWLELKMFVNFKAYKALAFVGFIAAT